MKTEQNQNLKTTIIIIIVTSIITSLTTAVIIFNNNKLTSTINSINLSQDEALQEFLSIYASLTEDYYEDIDKQKMIEEIIAAMFNYLGEDYSTYLNKKETEQLTQKLEGEYQGVGIEIINNNVIYNVFENSPAQKIGLRVGDIILKVNNEDVIDKLIPDLIKEGSSEVKLTIQRNEEILEFTMNIENVIIKAIETEIIEKENKRIGYIKITTFSNTVYSQFKTALSEMENQNIDSLILDVRSNSGGYLTAASSIASLFLEKGKVIYSLESKDEKQVYKDTTDEKRQYPVAVLINGASASASEILAAALKDSYGATLIGTTSYGKGKVQQTKTLETGGMIKYTSSKWYTPNDVCIDGYGITPNKEVHLPEYIEGVETEDTQKEAAVNHLIGQ